MNKLILVLATMASFAMCAEEEGFTLDNLVYLLGASDRVHVQDDYKATLIDIDDEDL